MNAVRHNHFAAHGSGKIFRAGKLRENAFHLFCICRDIVSDRTVAPRYGAYEISFFVLQFERSAVEFVFDEVFAVVVLLRPA